MFRVDIEIIRNETEFENDILLDELIYDITFYGLSGRATFNVRNKEINCIWNYNEELNQVEFQFDNNFERRN